MPFFDIEWTAKGKARVEADDAEEAEEILNEALELQDTNLLEGFDVDAVIIDSNEEVR